MTNEQFEEWVARYVDQVTPLQLTLFEVEPYVVQAPIIQAASGLQSSGDYHGRTYNLSEANAFSYGDAQGRWFSS